MGIYWLAVNHTKREYVDPHKLGSGAKLREQAHSRGLGGALTVMLAEGVGTWGKDSVELVHDGGAGFYYDVEDQYKDVTEEAKQLIEDNF